MPHIISGSEAVQSCMHNLSICSHLQMQHLPEVPGCCLCQGRQTYGTRAKHNNNSLFQTSVTK